MAGYIANIINLITSNLNDRYHNGFPVLKELIQNADDSKATRFVFGAHAGFDLKVQHPLLQGPSLWFFNNGEFKSSDKRAIRSFGENSKAGENSSIGKFGLGMKSVFHLCEAFFYIAYDGNEVHREILNPWDTGEENHLHKDWNECAESDWEKLEELAKEQFQEDKTWFLLWIPLRRESHLRLSNGEISGAIINAFPGDDHKRDLGFLDEPDLPRQFANLLPLLPRLEWIIFQPGVASHRQGFSIHLRSEGRLELDPQAINAKASGMVMTNEEKVPMLQFFGQKRLDQDKLFERMRDHEKWPKTYCRDEFGKSAIAFDKSKSESAVVISQAQEYGALTVQWAVFLPLEEDSHIFAHRIPSSTHHYHIILHGQFFIDAGRRGIHDFQRLSEDKGNADLETLDDQALRRCWNQELAQRVTLPLVLPTLDQYIREHHLKDKDIIELTHALCEAAATDSGRKFGETYKKYLCQNHAWVKVLSEAGSQWQLLENHLQRRLLPLPTPPLKEPERPWLVLPGLSRLEDVVFVDADAPALQMQNYQWQQEDWLTVLNEGASIFDSSPALDYFSTFLEVGGPYRKTAVVQNRLLLLLLKGFSTHVGTLKENRQKIQRVIENAILPEHRLSLGPKDPNARTAFPDKLWSTLWNCDTQILLLPAYLDGLTESTGKPSPEDVLCWLQALQSVMESKLADAALMVAGELLKKLDDSQRSQMIRSHRHLKVVSARDAASQNRKIAVSFEDLEQAKQGGSLFAFAGGLGEQQLGLAKLLAEVAPEERILLIRAEDRKIVFSESEKLPSADDPQAILSNLGKGDKPKRLHNAEKRQKLLEAANNPNSDPDAVRGLRYLLHGDAEHWQDIESPLWVRGYEQSPAWETLWQQLTGIEGEDAWNVLALKLADAIPKNKWSILEIRQIEPEKVVEELRRSDQEAINGAAFTEQERQEILIKIDDRELWRNIPLHTFEGGEIGAIDQTTYIATSLDLPEKLKKYVKFIRSAKDARLQSQQEKWVPELDHNAAAGVALNTANPVEYWELLLDAASSQRDLSSHNGEYKMKPWLPLENGKSIAPQDIIDISKLKDDIQRLAAKSEYCYAGVEDITSEVRRHPQFETLRNFFFIRDQEALGNFGLLINEAQDYALGDIHINNADLLKKAASALKLYQQLPGWLIIHKTIEAFGAEVCLNKLLPQIKTPIDQQQIIETLQWLATQSEQGQSGADKAHSLYLTLFAARPEIAQTELPKLRLRSQAGQWKTADALCSSVSGIEPDALLDQEQANILKGIIIDANLCESNALDQMPDAKIDTMLEASPKNLRDYFEPWARLMRSAPIGAWLALLGIAVREQAEDYLLPHFFDSIIAELDWRVPGERIDGVKDWMGGLSAGEALNSLAVAVKVINEEKVDVINLLGNTINVALENHPKTLIAGPLLWKGEKSSQKRVVLPMRKLDASLYEADELSELLQRTAEDFLHKAYNQPHANLQTLWQRLDHSDQLEIAVARATILNDLGFYLRQLGAHNLPVFKQAIAAYRTATKRLTEAKEKCEGSKIQGLEKEVKACLERLAHLLNNTSEAQNSILEKIRAKLSDSQYALDGIPFELFQNADDAAVELGRCESYSEDDIDIPDAARRFMLVTDGSIIRALHWGRLLNYRGPHRVEERFPGFGDDLEKMLILSASDKSDDDQTTGKFGLGFKSVFLISDNPRILSGDLRVQIVGGVLPELWNESSNAASILAKQSVDRHYRGTAIELPLRDNIYSHEIIERFRKNAALLSIFAKAIRHIEVDDVSFDWSPETPLSGLEVSEIDNLPEVERLVVFRFEYENAVVAIPIGPKGFVPFPREVPSLWVTAPTRLSDSFGFAVSAPFGIDPGRGQLSGNNDRIAESVGKALGRKLVDLYRESAAHWLEWQKHLRLIDDITHSEFWASLWEVLSEGWLYRPVESGYGLGRTLATSALRVLLEEIGHIPTGLPRPFADLIPHNTVRFEVADDWAKQDILDALYKWGVLQEKERDCSIITSKIAKALRQIEPSIRTTVLNIRILVNLLEDQHCDPVSARLLETILTKLPENEQQEADAALSTLQFQSQKGNWQESRYLLCRNADKPGDQEETMRAAFAPDQFLLSQAYDEAGVQFFKRSRPRFEADTSRLVEWAMQACQPVMQQAVLCYILKGDLGSKMAHDLRAKQVGSWLEGFGSQHPALHGFDSSERDQLCRLLQQEIYYEPYRVESPIQPQIPFYQPDALARVFEWWEEEGREMHLRSYERSLYPRGELPRLVRDEDGCFDRTGWMTLFTIAVFQRLGRVRDFQTRSFLESLEHKGWWQIFCESDPRHEGKDWLQVLRDFAENQIDDEEYSYWLDSFPRLFKIATWLETYVELFEGINQRSANEISLLLMPNADPILQGSGIFAPPLNRTLRKGSNLVIRELLRMDVIQNQAAIPHAYMPSKKILRLLESMSLYDRVESSEDIHRILVKIIGPERARFGGDYDIPLQILALSSNSDLLWQICQVELDELDDLSIELYE